MPEYKLTYFNSKGNAEQARWLFALAGQKYEDVRLDREKWQHMKSSTPFAQLPLLEVGDVMICQSKSICRYLARQFGYAGKSDLDQAQVDMVVDCTTDAIKPLFETFFEKDKDNQVEKKKKLEEEQAPDFLTKFEKLLSNNGGDWFVGDDITWADLAVASYLGLFALGQFSVDMDKYPKLKSLKERVESHPGIAEWIKNRPDTPH